MIILYDNKVLAATSITALTEHPDYLFEDALQDTRLSRIGRTLDDDDQYIIIDMGAAVTCTYVAVLQHNFTSGATVKIQANSSNSWITPPLDVTITTISDEIVQSFTSSNYRYWRLTMDDASNPDTYLSVGYLYLGTALTMPGMNQGSVITYDTNSKSTKSFSGCLYGDTRLNFKSATFNFNNSGETNRQELITFFSTVSVIRPFILLIWENDLDVEPPIYCNLTDSIKYTKEKYEGTNWGFSFTIEQCF